MKKIFQQGIYLIDKPYGVSSHTVVNWFRKFSESKKVGHTGTLDPLASGLLIILVGRNFTKQQANYLKQDKEYICQVKLGIVSTSYDLDGEISSTAEWNELAKIEKRDIEFVMKDFVGEISQQVPIFSAVKKDGKKLYEIARSKSLKEKDQNLKNEIWANLPVRKIKINHLELVNFDKNESLKELTFSFKVHCSSGTYIRSLAHDIGQKLKVGATVISLRRTKIGSFSIDDALLCPLLFKKNLIVT